MHQNSNDYTDEEQLSASIDEASAPGLHAKFKQMGSKDIKFMSSSQYKVNP